MSDRSSGRLGCVEFGVLDHPDVDQLQELVQVDVLQFFEVVAVEDLFVANRPFGGQIQDLQ